MAVTLTASRSRTPCASGGCGGATFGAETGRSSFDDVCDYNGLRDSGAKDRQGAALSGLSGYTVNVSVLDGSSVSLGSPALSATAGRVVRLEVQVSNPGLSSPITLVGYKANLE